MYITGKEKPHCKVCRLYMKHRIQRDCHSPFDCLSMFPYQALYEQSLHIKSAIPHPLIMGVIRGRSDMTVVCLLPES